MSTEVMREHRNGFYWSKIERIDDNDPPFRWSIWGGSHQMEVGMAATMEDARCGLEQAWNDCFDMDPEIRKALMNSVSSI